MRSFIWDALFYFDGGIMSKDIQKKEDNLDKLIREAFKHAVEKDVAEFDAPPQEKFEPSRRFKIRMNRFFRERIGCSAPYPEADNRFERIRSKIVTKSTKFGKYVEL